MPLSKQQIEVLVRLVRLTAEHEIDCDECLALVTEYIELRMAGAPIPECLEVVEQHMSVCGECREVIEAVTLGLEDTGVVEGGSETIHQ
jgi:hypothetical protein